MKNSTTAQRVSFMGLMFAMAMALSFLESTISIPGLIPGVRLGLSNIVTMFCLFALGLKCGATIAVMKSAFVLLTRGAVAALMSLSGGLCSVLIMFLALRAKKLNLSYLVISIFGAVSHNIGQILVARFLVGTHFIYYYIPLLIISGVIVGVVTGMVLKVVMPSLMRLLPK